MLEVDQESSRQSGFETTLLWPMRLNVSLEQMRVVLLRLCFCKIEPSPTAVQSRRESTIEQEQARRIPLGTFVSFKPEDLTAQICVLLANLPAEYNREIASVANRQHLVTMFY